ncbi:MAG: MFS transporter [Bacillota bacterium]|nr:MFS transporter [Bacillota bacterium]
MDRKNNVYLMYAIVFLQGLIFYGPIATLYRQHRGISMYDIFLIESISWILMIIFEVPWGFFADRFGYKKTLIISNFIYFFSKIIFYEAHSFGMFLLERVFLSLALSGISGCDIALLYSSAGEDESEKVIGRYSAVATAGFLAASLLSTAIVGRSMDETALLTIIPYGLAALLTFFLRDIEMAQERRPKLRKSLKNALRNRQILLIVISAALGREVIQAVSVFLNQAQYIRSGIDIKYFGILTAAVQIIPLSAAKAHAVSERLGKLSGMLLLYSIIAVSCLTLIFTRSAPLSILCIILAAGSMSLAAPMALDMQNKSITTGDRATILSVYAMGGDLIGALFNPVIGGAADVSVEAAFAVCFIICILVCLTLLIYRKKSKEEII